MNTYNNISDDTLTDQELRYLMVTEGAHLGLWDWNIQTGEVYFNEQWYTLLGYRPYELPASFDTFEKLCHPDDYKEAMNILNNHFKDDAVTYKANIRMKHKKGHWIWIFTSGKVMQRDKAGRALRAYGIHLDVSEQVKAEQALKEANHKLEQFAFMASHDMKTPLRTIGLALGFIQRETPQIREGQNKKSFDFIISAINSLQLMLEDFLAFARNDQNAQQTKQFCAEEATAELIELLDFSLKKHKAKVTFTELPIITANKARFMRVLQNLISNALIYSSEDRKTKILISFEDHKKHYLFCVKDNGIGIPEEKLQAVFEPYVQLQDNPDALSLGLGLSMVQLLLEDMGGEVWAQSEVGVGSKFYFTIPK